MRKRSRATVGAAALSVALAAGLPLRAAEPAGVAPAGYRQVTIPLSIKSMEALRLSSGVLHLPRTYVQGADGRVVMEAEQATSFALHPKAFDNPGNAFRGVSPTASGQRFLIYVNNGAWEMDIAEPVRLVPWYRAFFPHHGHWNHSETLEGAPSRGPSDLNTEDPSDARLRRWLWVQGEPYDLAAGRHSFALNWLGGTRLDQLAWLPAGATPGEDDMFPPTMAANVPASGVVITEPVTVQAGQRPERLQIVRTPEDGAVTSEVSTDGGRTWHPLPADGSLAGLASPPGDALAFRVSLRQSEDRSSPTVQGLALAMSVPARPPVLDAASRALLAPVPELDLVPADWTAVRPRAGGWTLVRALQPDARGALWLDAAAADGAQLWPASASWWIDEPSSAASRTLYQGVLNRNLLSFDLQVPEAADFEIWFRLRLYGPDAGTRQEYTPAAQFQVDRGDFLPLDLAKMENFPSAGFHAQEWVWLHEPKRTVRLSAGHHVFRLRAGLDYCLLDRIALVPAGTAAPEGRGGESLRRVAAEGEVVFQPLGWSGLAHARTVDAEADAVPGARLDYAVSTDNGATWRATPADLASGTNAPVPPFLLKCRIAAGTGGAAPTIDRWSMRLGDDAPPALALTNSTQRILLDPASGNLLGWWSRDAGWLIPPGRSDALFALSTYLPGITSERTLVPTAADLAAITAGTIGRDTEVTLSLNVNEMVGARVRITMPEQGLVRWELEVANRSSLDIRALKFPLLKGVRLGADPEATLYLTTNGHGGPDFPGAALGIFPATYPSGIYPSHASMGWLCLYGDTGAFTFQVRDRDGVGTDIRMEPEPGAQTVGMRFARHDYVAPGATGTAHYAGGWLPGGWHAAADAYGAWAHTWMTFGNEPAWATWSDGRMVSCTMNTAERFASHYEPELHRMGADHLYHYGNALDAGLSCGAFPMLHPFYGTPAEFRAAHALARARGWRNTYYWNLNTWFAGFEEGPVIGYLSRDLLPEGVNIPAPGFAERYCVRTMDGVAQKSYATQYSPDTRYMCCASTGWKDYLVEGMATNYAGLCGADGVYLDQAGIRFAFCYAADHGHGQQHGLFSRGLIEAMDRAMSEARQVNPDFVFYIEGATDQIMQHASFGLWVGSPYVDGTPVLYTFPEVKLLRGDANPGGEGPRTRPEYVRFIQLAMRGDFSRTTPAVQWFFRHRPRIRDWMYRGRFMDDRDLRVSRPGIVAKWFRCDADGYTGAVINVQNEFGFSNATVSVDWPVLSGVTQARAYTFEDAAVTLHTAPGQGGGLTVPVPASRASSILLIVSGPAPVDAPPVPAEDAPLRNGGFETDTGGRGSPDAWRTQDIDAFTLLVQQKDLPFPFTAADGVRDATAPAEGAYSLRLDGAVTLPYTWCRRGLNPIPREWFFNTAQWLHLQPGRRYRLEMQYRLAAPDGKVVVSVEYPMSDMNRRPLAFAPAVLTAGKDRTGAWQTFSVEFDTPSGTPLTPAVHIVNVSRQPAWIDAVTLTDAGPARTEPEFVYARDRYAVRAAQAPAQP